MGEEWIDVFFELTRYQNEGIKLYLGDTESSPEEITRACAVCETSYMRDYIMDQEGVVEIRFDKIN